MAHALASETENLQTTFFQLLEKKLLLETDTKKQAARNIYEEMLRKLSNTRIQEFISSLKQKIASDKGQASVAGQNLRYKLLTAHINVQSRVHI